jgi:hypothetical protein
MTITFTTANIQASLRQISHLEVQDIPDAEARDNARAGLDKIDEVNRCLAHGFAQVRRRCWRFLADDDTNSKTRVYIIPGNTVFNLNLSERRMLDKAEAISSAMEKLAIDYALSMFYSSVNQPELSKKHSLAAVDAGTELDELLYAKKPPRV